MFAGYGGFVTFVKSNAKALSTDVPSIKTTLAPFGGTETFTLVSLPGYIPNHHHTVSLQDTILLQNSFPFWSEPIHHQSTLPYALKEMTPISFGVTNIMLYMVLGVAQLLIERKMKLDILLEVPFSFIMGYILDLYQIIIPASSESLGLRIVILLAGNICIAFGVYTMVQSHLVLAPVDGVILSISNHYNKAYSLCKNCFDITMIVLTTVLCLVTRLPLYGIGVGTIFSALCVGRIIKWFEIKQVSLIRS